MKLTRFSFKVMALSCIFFLSQSFADGFHAENRLTIYNTTNATYALGEESTADCHGYDFSELREGGIHAADSIIQPAKTHVVTPDPSQWSTCVFEIDNPHTQNRCFVEIDCRGDTGCRFSSGTCTQHDAVMSSAGSALLIKQPD